MSQVSIEPNLEKLILGLTMVVQSSDTRLLAVRNASLLIVEAIGAYIVGQRSESENLKKVNGIKQHTCCSDFSMHFRALKIIFIVRDSLTETHFASFTGCHV